MPRFAARFEGPENRDLRIMIRNSVKPTRCGDANAHAVLDLARIVKLTALGHAMLAKVALDYKSRGAKEPHACDCHACTASNLEALS